MPSYDVLQTDPVLVSSSPILRGLLCKLQELGSRLWVQIGALVFRSSLCCFVRDFKSVVAVGFRREDFLKGGTALTRIRDGSTTPRRGRSHSPLCCMAPGVLASGRAQPQQ